MKDEDSGLSKVIWVCIGLTSFAFVAAGGAKLAGVEQLHQSFAQMGLPGWFGYFIGLAEVLGGVGLWFRRFSPAAAAGLLIIMFGATYYHAAYDSIANAVPAVLLSLLLVAILTLRKKQPAS